MELLSQARVRQLLGTPDSVVVANDSADSALDDSPEWWWHYQDLAVSASRSLVEGMLLTTSRYATARGLRVGDTAKRLMTLYGRGKSTRDARASKDSVDWVSRFLFADDSVWTYQRSMSPEEREGLSREALEVVELVSRQFGIRVWVRSGKVACIYVGRMITELSWWGC